MKTPGCIPAYLKVKPVSIKDISDVALDARLTRIELMLGIINGSTEGSTSTPGSPSGGTVTIPNDIKESIEKLLKQVEALQEEDERQRGVDKTHDMQIQAATDHITDAQATAQGINEILDAIRGLKD